ncbi:hypothetical protein HDU91_006748, partial [Kappamyces sp. JEL0680]
MATKKGTAAFASRFPRLSYATIPLLGMRTMPGLTLDIQVSRLGFGAFRLLPQHRDTLKSAILSGMNLIDTSGHFGGGRSEETVGGVVKSLVDESLVARESLCVVTKAGFLFDAPKVYPDAVHIKDGQYHCISPTFLEDQITHSLSRLGLDQLDVFMLNNPERLLQASDRSVGEGKLYDSIAAAFEHLEKEVARGRIASFGVASNTMHLSSASDHLSLVKMLASRPKHLSAIEYPFNLFEREGVEESLDGSPSLAETCVANGIYQITQRPFISMTRSGVQKLVTRPLGMDETAINQEATDQFEVVTELEVELAMMLGSEDKEASLISKFVIAQIVAENLGRLAQNEMAAELYFRRDILPALDRDLEELRQYGETAAKPQQAEFLRDWIPSYRAEAQSLLDRVKAVAAWHSNRTNEELNSIVSLRAHRHAPLATNALAVCLSATAAFPASVLVGTRQKEHLAQS